MKPNPSFHFSNGVQNVFFRAHEKKKGISGGFTTKYSIYGDFLLSRLDFTLIKPTKLQAKVWLNFQVDNHYNDGYHV